MASKDLNTAKIYRSHWESAEKLSDEDRLEFYDAVFRYMFAGEESSFKGFASDLLFGAVKPNLDKYISDVENGSKGGTSKNGKGGSETSARGVSDTSDRGVSQDAPSKDKEEDKEEVEDKEDEEDKKRTKAKFTPPSVDEIREYVRERGYTHTDPETVWNFYDSKGWKVGNQPMKNWKSAVSGWESRKKNETARSGTTKKVNKFNNFDQRKYDYDTLTEKLLAR